MSLRARAETVGGGWRAGLQPGSAGSGGRTRAQQRDPWAPKRPSPVPPRLPQPVLWPPSPAPPRTGVRVKSWARRSQPRLRPRASPKRRGCGEGEGTLGQDGPVGTASRGKVAQGKHAPPGGTGLEGLRAKRAERARWATEVGLGRPPRGKRCPSTVLFVREGLKGRQLEAVTKARGWVGDHRGEEEAIAVAADDPTTACWRGRKERPRWRINAAVGRRGAWGPGLPRV